MNLIKKGFEVTLVEKEPHILALAFDEDIAVDAENVLKERGVHVLNGVGVKEIVGNKKSIKCFIRQWFFT